LEFLPITSGLLAGQNLKLLPFQREIINSIYAVDGKGKRRVKTAVLSVPRKNGKTQLASGLALCHLCGPESESRGQIFSAASDREQAGLVFREMQAIILRTPELAKKCRIQSFTKTITDLETGSIYCALSSDSRKAHGLSPSFTIFDELAQSKDRELYDNLVTGRGARKQPLMIVISTQTQDVHHVLSGLIDYHLSIQSGALPNDPTFYGYVASAPMDADPWDEKTWFSCNPALGIFRSLEEMREFAEMAQKIPAQESVFRALYLNQRVSAEGRWISTGDFEACVGNIPDLSGRECYLGLDLSATQDLSAASLCFVPIEENEPFYTLHFAWCPENGIRNRSKSDRVPYDLWHRQGHIQSTPGSVIDYSYILKRIEAISKQYNLKAILFDRWGSTKIVKDLENMGLTVIEFGQGFASLSPPSKEMEKLILSRKIVFPDNPALKWCFSNVITEIDAAGNVKPSKKKSKEKIDMVVSTVMALDGALRNTKKEVTPSISWL
jgi:phage terminase large subunit-like protein